MELLPNEVLSEINEYLDFEGLKAFRTTNQHLSSLIAQDEYQKLLLQKLRQLVNSKKVSESDVIHITVNTYDRLLLIDENLKTLMNDKGHLFYIDYVYKKFGDIDSGIEREMDLIFDGKLFNGDTVHNPFKYYKSSRELITVLYHKHYEGLISQMLKYYNFNNPITFYRLNYEDIDDEYENNDDIYQARSIYEASLLIDNDVALQRSIICRLITEYYDSFVDESRNYIKEIISDDDAYEFSSTMYAIIKQSDKIFRKLTLKN